MFLHGRILHCIFVVVMYVIVTIGIGVSFKERDLWDFFFFFGLFRATPVAYGGSQARG